MKYKILIVDDEPFIAKTIKKMIEVSTSDFEVVDITFNGKMALQKIKLLNPDVVFTDIKMPIMDGLELISRLKADNSTILFVILSGYQEFEYARKALQEGVMDYLLKPLSADTLNPLLHNIYNRLNSKFKTSQMDALKAILNSPSQDISPMNASSLFNSNKYLYVLINSGSYFSFPCSWITHSEEFWNHVDVHSILSQYLEHLSNWFLCGVYPNEKILIISAENMSLERANELCKKIHEAFLIFDFPMTSVAGIHDEPIGLLNSSIMKARMFLQRNTLFSFSSYIFLESKNIKSNKQTILLDNSTREYLLLLFKNNQHEKLHQELKGFFDLLEKNMVKQLVLGKNLREILGLFCSTFDPSEMTKTEEYDMLLDELISNSCSYQSLYSGFSQIVDDIFELKKPDSRNYFHKKDLIDKIEQYILCNYTNQINLQDLSNMFGLVSPYLSRIFREAKGLSPNDYILQLRIERVKKMLDIQPQIPLKVISEAVGFNNQFYLSKVFKMITGNSPSQYREK